MNTLKKLSGQLSELIAAVKNLKLGDSLDVHVSQAATDWNMLWATLFSAFGAAFVGALLAYLFNVYSEKRHERENEWKILIRSKNSLIVLLNPLYNFKRQFLIEYSIALFAIQDYAAQFTPMLNPSLVQEYQTTIRPIIQFLSTPERNWNGALQKWDIIDTPILFKPEDLTFTLDDHPDDMRIFVLVVEQLKSVDRRITLRNEIWPAVAANVNPFRPDFACMSHLYDFLRHRENVQETVNITLAVVHEAIVRIDGYITRNFPPLPWYKKWIRRKRKNIRFKLPNNIEFLTPDPKQYSSILKMPSV